MTDATPIEFVRRQHPFDHLSNPELKLISESLEIESFAAGEYVLRQDGQSSQYLYLIRNGLIRLARDGKIIQVLEEGECFGYPSMINFIPPTADAIGEEAGQLYLIPKRVFEGLTENSPFAEFFLKDLGERLRRITANTPPTIGGDLTTAVGSLVVRPPITVSPTTTVAEAARAMRKAWVDVALINGNPPGIITDHDFQVKVLAEGLGPQTLVNQVMSRPLKSLPAETPVHGVLLFILEENIHHLPVTRNGEIVGVVTATDLLRHQSRSPIYLIRHLEKLESLDELGKYSVEIAGIVENLYRGGLDITQIGRVIASINDTLIRRLLRLAEEDLGPPPTPYAWLVFGSEGRMEQALLTDQDNALVYQEDTPEAKTYFRNLTQHVVDNLIKAGFPPCPGGYMATNWYQPLDDWVKRFKGWITTPNPQALLETAIFFDFRSVYGELSVEPLDDLIHHASEHGIFLAHLAKAAMEFRPPLGFFRRIRAENGQVDLKAGGIAPVVSLARVYALEAGLRIKVTVARLEAAAKAGTLSHDGADNLIETYRFLLQLRLDEQLAAIKTGSIPDNKIYLQNLSSRENRHLKDAFLVIREMQEAATQRFRTDMLG